jgi:penicillin-binding protein 1C
MRIFNHQISLRRSQIKKLTITLLLILAAGIFLDRIVFPLPETSLKKPSATFVYSRGGILLGCFTSRDSFWRKPVKLSEISPLLVSSVLASEDQWFYYHPGVNFVSLISAAYNDIKAGKIVRGGSTISMQIARMMEPKDRTLKAKIIEILRAFQLELHYSKKELLELYFNLAPYGGNIEGVGAASYFYFGKRPIELTASQAALLVSIPNSPTALRPDINLPKSLTARDKVLAVMLRRGIILKAKYHEALNEEIAPHKSEPPQIAPHFTRDLAMSNPGRPEIISTIDYRLQNICDGVVKNHHDELKLRGINNIALVVLKNSTAEVLAMVGSSDFHDTGHQGQVNGACSPRSPGSALKPFLYGMALDKGLISPNSIIEDLPVYYSGYSPENYDRQYRGAVSAAEALKLSLNVPAVSTLARVGQQNFYSLLKLGGISTLNRKSYEYGLPLILGSAEVTLIDLSNLYATLAREGKFIPYKMEISQPEGDSLRLFSPAASYIISEILTELERPDFPASWEFSPNIPKIAWKTGTSYGRKDAWSIGYNPEYTVGVWVGNFSGEPSPDLVGAEAAAPVLFDIFSALGQERNSQWFSQPSSVSSREVCATSGTLPNDVCPARVTELYIPGVSPVTVCTIHKEIMVDSVSGYQLCRYCSFGKKVINKIYEDWPPKLASWLAASGKNIETIPEHNPECTGALYGEKPIIISPNDDVIYFVRNYLPVELQQISLEASISGSAKNLFWFIDGELFGKSRPGEKLFYTPKIGIHKLTCSDDEGRSSSMVLKIEQN